MLLNSRFTENASFYQNIMGANQ